MAPQLRQLVDELLVDDRAHTIPELLDALDEAQAGAEPEAAAALAEVDRGGRKGELIAQLAAVLSAHPKLERKVSPEGEPPEVDGEPPEGVLVDDVVVEEPPAPDDDVEAPPATIERVLAFDEQGIATILDDPAAAAAFEVELARARAMGAAVLTPQGLAVAPVPPRRGELVPLPLPPPPGALAPRINGSVVLTPESGRRPEPLPDVMNVIDRQQGSAVLGPVGTPRRPPAAPPRGALAPEPPPLQATAGTRLVHPQPQAAPRDVATGPLIRWTLAGALAYLRPGVDELRRRGAPEPTSSLEAVLAVLDALEDSRGA